MDDAVAQRLSESAASPAFWTSEDRRKALNDGYMEMADASEFFERTTPIQQLARRTYYDLRGFLFNNVAILTIKRIFVPATTEWLRATQVRDLDGDRLGPQFSPRWEHIGGTLRHFFMRGLFWLGLAPRPDTDDEAIRIHHTSLPNRMEEDDDVPLFPEQFHPGIVDYAVYDLLVRDREVSMALEHWQKYQKHEKELTEYVDQRQSVDRIIRMDEEWPQ